jgi:hypothetical protein
MSYGEKQIYKDTRAVQWCKEGLVCELADVAEKLMIASTKEGMENILNTLSLDIQTLLDALETLKISEEYYAEKEAEQ